MTSDDRDLVIREFADAEAALLDHVAALETEREAYRLLAQLAIHALYAITHAPIHEQHERLLDEHRHLREQIMSEALA